MVYRAGSKVDRTPIHARTKRSDVALGMNLEMLDLRTAGDADRSLAAKAIVRWLSKHKEDGTMATKERADAWNTIAGALGVLEATELIGGSVYHEEQHN